MNSCQAQSGKKMNHQHTNALISETSPYLLQHAHNPVDWYPWGDDAFDQAKSSNKLVIVSIGYSACHWCHVMERESFEDSTAAALMNEKFVSVKVDREERPDVDQIYMTAVQLMSGRGGWPLNVICLPDGRPIWGGTYFPKQQWMEALNALDEVYRNEPEKVLEYAEKLHQGIVQSEIVEVNPDPPAFDVEEVRTIYNNWDSDFDKKEGGSDRAPKFPMPNNWQYMLRFGHLDQNQGALDQVRLTLQKMAFGGIYDQVGGGFARYSTDAVWKVPHFEKMLYDNAQLVSLYSEAYTKFKDPLYKSVVAQTLEWVERELTGPDGEFYSALDADSEGEEGKFYIWKESELQALIPADDWALFKEYYNINERGLWEHGNYILLRHATNKELAQQFSIEESSIYEKANGWNEILLNERSGRVRPGLDDKSLTSWNALMCSGYVKAYKSFGNNSYLDIAEKNAQWILKNQVRRGGRLFHTYKKGKSGIDGLLEDYAFAIQAFLDLFEVTFNEDYLLQAEKWSNYVKSNFEDEKTALFYTRNLKGSQLIAKSQETVDNVIPASNSTMARNLFRLSHYLDQSDYRDQAVKMMNQVKSRMMQYAGNYSNWGHLMLDITYPHFEVAVTGVDAKNYYRQFLAEYNPNVLLIGSDKKSKLPLLERRYVEGKTLIYVCQNKVCELPSQSAEEALELIRDYEN